MRVPIVRKPARNATKPDLASAVLMFALSICLCLIPDLGVKYGVSEECVDSQRKERKKGTKRGPYRKRDGKGMYAWVPPPMTLYL